MHCYYINLSAVRTEICLVRRSKEKKIPLILEEPSTIKHNKKIDPHVLHQLLVATFLLKRNQDSLGFTQKHIPVWKEGF